MEECTRVIKIRHFNGYISSCVLFLATNDISACAAFTEKSHNILTVWYSEGFGEIKILESRDPLTDFGKLLNWSLFSLCSMYSTYSTYNFLFNRKVKIKNTGKLTNKKQVFNYWYALSFTNLSPKVPNYTNIPQTCRQGLILFAFQLQQLSMEWWRLCLYRYSPWGRVLSALLRPISPSQGGNSFHI